MGLFGRKKAKNRLYYIEIDDEGIDKQISEIIIEIHTRISEFKEQMNQVVPNREEKLQELYRLMMDLKEKVQHLQNDVKKVTELKLKNQDYFIIKDDSFLEDKKNQLENMLQTMSNFLNIVEQQPSTTELKNELLNTLITELNQIVDDTKHIIADDYHLRTIYKRLTEM